MRKTKPEKVKERRKDFINKKNILHNNIPLILSKGVILSAGDGRLPKSRKFKNNKKKKILSQKFSK